MILNSTFFFCCPQQVSIFLLPTDEATAKSVKTNSPTDSEKQTAVASKDKGFFDKALALSYTYHISQDPYHFGVTHLFSVCAPDNMKSHATNKNCTGAKQVGTQEPEEEQQAPKTPSCSTPSSPTKAANDTLEQAVMLLPAILHPRIIHFGH